MTYTIDNPKKVYFITGLEEVSFTGVVKDEEGNIAYFVNGKYHREDGPAVIWTNGSVFYLKHGKYHREDGPAVIYSDGAVVYYLNHEKLPILTDQELKDYLILRMLE